MKWATVIYLIVLSDQLTYLSNSKNRIVHVTTWKQFERRVERRVEYIFPLKIMETRQKRSVALGTFETIAMALNYQSLIAQPLAEHSILLRKIDLHDISKTNKDGN